MSDDEEWGEWQDHDGKGCPCVGEYIQLCLDRRADKHPPFMKRLDAMTFEGIYDSARADAAEWTWDWGARIIRFRIRKPRALRDLIAMVENLPAPAAPKVAPKVDA